MTSEHVTIPLAFVAGLLSFASPCVLPLVPAYLGYLGGTALSAQHTHTRRAAFEPFLHALSFVLGFAAVFVLLGASATLVGGLLIGFRLLLQRVGGVVLLVFGLRLMGTGWSRKGWIVAAILVAAVTFAFDSKLALQGRIDSPELLVVWIEESMMMGLVALSRADWRWVPRILLALAAGVLNALASFDSLMPTLLASVLIAGAVVLFNQADVFYAERRLELKHGTRASLARSALIGVLFAAGWTPCIGPILTAILVLASQLETAGQGMLLLGAYSLGLGIPFLVFGLAFGSLSGWLRRMNRYVHIVSAVSGALLALMGILVFTESLGFFARFGSFLDIG
jgi:cytochrome c-type biogenesis protein